MEGGARVELYMVAVEGVASEGSEGSRKAVGMESAEEGAKELRLGRERLGADSWRLMGGGAKGCCWTKKGSAIERAWLCRRQRTMEQLQRVQIQG